MINMNEVWEDATAVFLGLRNFGSYKIDLVDNDGRPQIEVRSRKYGTPPVKPFQWEPTPVLIVSLTKDCDKWRWGRYALDEKTMPRDRHPREVARAIMRWQSDAAWTAS